MPDGPAALSPAGAVWWDAVHIEALLPDGSAVAHPAIYLPDLIWWGIKDWRFMTETAFLSCITCGCFMLPPDPPGFSDLPPYQEPPGA